MDSEGISERKVEFRVRKNGRKDKVIVEKSAAEGLPEGWIKKLVLTYRTGRKIRRDPFFIDPKSEYIFQSFKDASRYVKTGDIGHYARKLKENDIEDDDSGNGKPMLPLESVEKRTAEGKINIYVRSSKRRNLSSSDEHTENREMNSSLSNVTSQVLEDLGKKEEAKDPISNQPVAKRVTRSQAKASKNEEDRDLKRNHPPSPNAKSKLDTVRSRLTNASSQSPEKTSVMKEEEVQDSTERRITRSKAKVETSELTNSLVRRASKRLAGIELEPTPELKTRTKAQRIVPPDDGTAGNCEQPVSPVTTGGLKKTDIPFHKEVAESGNEISSRKPNADATSNNCVSAEVKIEQIGKPAGRSSSGEKKKMKTALVISEAELNPVFHLDGYKQKEDMSPVSPLSRQSSATKCENTVARKRMSSPKAKVTSPKRIESSSLGSSNKGMIPHPTDNGNATARRNKLGNESSKSSVVRGGCSEVTEKTTNSFASAFDSTLADLWKDPCIAFAIKTLTGESLHIPNTAGISSDPKNNHTKQKGVSFLPETPGNVSTSLGNPGFPSECADIWKDPCIDFAIKTLTGAIPIELDEQKSEGTAITAATREQEGRQSSSCDNLIQQCSSNMKNNKTAENSGDLRFTQSFSKK